MLLTARSKLFPHNVWHTCCRIRKQNLENSGTAVIICFFFTFEFQFFLSIFLIYCHYFSLKFYLNEEMQEISITNFFSEGQPQKFNFELKIEEFEIAFLQLSNTRNYFYSFFFQLSFIRRFVWTYSWNFIGKKNSKKIENFTKISNFFRIYFSKKILRVGANELHDQGKYKNHYLKKFECWTAVGMRFQIPRFWVSSSFLTAFRHIVFQKKKFSNSKRYCASFEPTNV